MKSIYSLAALLFLSACQVVPKNLDDAGQDRDGLFVRQVNSVEPQHSYSQLHNQDAIGSHLWWNAPVSLHTELAHTVVLQAGDLVRINCAPFSELSGLYQITAQANLELPFLGLVNVRGLSAVQVEQALQQRLRQSQWLQGDLLSVQLSVVESAPISVVIRGAVFNAGVSILNARSKQDPVAEIRQQAGVFTHSRNLLQGLASAGGVRPDADLSRVFLKRADQVYQYDLSSAITGVASPSVPDLQNGDQIYVASTGREQIQLIRPSPITPPGMRVFMSNLTAPALSNAQSAIGNDASRVPYGVSLIDVAVSANCVGGTQMANASRSIVLVTRNYGSTAQIVIQRSIDDLLADSSNPLVNPYVMPNDSVACYDSRFTNFRDVARGIGELISPIILGRLL